MARKRTTRAQRKATLLRIFFTGSLVIVFALLWYSPVVLSVAKPALVHLENVPVQPVQASQGSIFSYSRLGIQAPLQETPNTAPYNYADWASIAEQLRHGVNLSYPGSSYGSAPILYVTGHSSDTYPHPYSSIFAAFGQAEVGDKVLLQRQDGSQHVYTVKSKKVVNPALVRQYVEEQSHIAGKQIVALVTCWVPLTTLNRMVIIAS